jgi:hypothetical protein
MSAFTFPLPPPPPPPSAAGLQSTEQSHRGGFQNRGFRGRGRGNSRGGFNQSNNRGGLNRGGHQQHVSQNHLSNGYPTSKNASWAQPTATQVPSFQAMQPVISNGYATSYSTTPGQYPNHYGQDGVPQSPQQYGSPPKMGPPIHMGMNSQHQLGQGNGSHAGFKRKRDQTFNSSTPKASQPKPESKPKVPVPPAIPSFGFSLPAKPPPVDIAPVPTPQKPNKKKQRKNNILGLTPQGEVHENSDDDIDEEAVFAQSGQEYVLSLAHVSLP